MSYAIRNGKLVKNGTPSTAPRPIQTNRTWAQGSISVVANDHDCFRWQGARIRTRLSFRSDGWPNATRFTRWALNQLPDVPLAT
jgi:hypothetical protein